MYTVVADRNPKSTPIVSFVVLDSALHYVRTHTGPDGWSGLAVFDVEPYGKKRTLRAFGINGQVRWAKQCPQCKGSGCDTCNLWGSIYDTACV